MNFKELKQVLTHFHPETKHDIIPRLKKLEEQGRILEINRVLQPYRVERVRAGKDGRTGYYRRIPITRFQPTKPQLKLRLAVGEAAYETYGTKGFEEVDGRMIPKTAAHVKHEVEGRTFGPPRIDRMIKDMGKALKKIGRLTAEAKKAKVEAT